MKLKYTILTFIIGKGYEKVHEILNKQDDVEYLMITDDSELKSDTWKVICDPDLSNLKTAFEKCFSIRYNVFKYCTTDVCVTVDGSMQIKGSLDKLIERFNDGNFDICLMPHPLWDTMVPEYQAWIKMRGYPVGQAQHAIDFLNREGCDFQYRGLYQLCFTIKRRSQLCQDIDKVTWQKLCELSEGLPQFERLDQTIFSFVMNRWFNGANVLPVSEQVVRSYAIQWFWHKSDNPNLNVFYDISKPDKKYLFNKEVECLYLK